MTQTVLTWHGHACFEIQNEKRILIDPFITGNPKTDLTKENVKADLVVVTHGHSDHLGDAVEIALGNGVPIVTMVELAWALKKEFKDLLVEGINLSGGVTVSGVRVRSVIAVHSSSYKDQYVGSPMGVVIGDGFKIYHAGDTGVFRDMELIREVHHPNLSILPIGGYYTMSPAEAQFAVSMLKSEYVVPMHYGTFPLISGNPEEFKELVDKTGVSRTIIAKVGVPIVFGSDGKLLE